MSGLHATVTPIVEITQPTTVDELLRCPAEINGMSAPSIEHDVMAHDIGPAGGACDEAEREMPHVNAYSGRHSPERSGSQHASGRHGAAQRGGDYQQARTQRQPWQQNERCTACGRWCDGNRNCPAYSKCCFGCHQLGHFVAQCRSSRR